MFFGEVFTFDCVPRKRGLASGRSSSSCTGMSSAVDVGPRLSVALLPDGILSFSGTTTDLGRR